MRQTKPGAWERVDDRRWQAPAHQVRETRTDPRSGREYRVNVAGIPGPSFYR
jgi:hypothetical protein